MNGTLRFGRLLGTLLFVTVLAFPALASNLTNFTTEEDTDFAAFGVGGMRGQGTGSIIVTGVSGTITRAYLYWHGPTNNPDSLGNASVTFDGTAVNGVPLGNSASNCWPFTISRAYRADVTSLVTGNDTYTLANFNKAATSDDVNGVSLLIFFDDGNNTNDKDIVVFHGNDSQQTNPFDDEGWNATLDDVNYASGTAEMQVIVSDGQTFPDNGISLTVGATSTTILSTGSNFEGTLPNQGTAGDTNGGLWDHRNFDITSLLSVGLNDITLTEFGGSSDCLSLIAVIFKLPAGSAPTPPTKPVLEITKTASTDAPVINTQFSYTITVANTGTVSATGVQVNDTLPAGLTYVSSSSTVGTCTFFNPTLVCDIGTLGAEAEAVISIVVTSSQLGEYENTALVDSNETDPVATLIGDAGIEIVEGVPVPASSDLALAALAMLLASVAFVTMKR